MKLAEATPKSRIQPSLPFERRPDTARVRVSGASRAPLPSAPRRRRVQLADLPRPSGRTPAPEVATVPLPARKAPVVQAVGLQALGQVVGTVLVCAACLLAVAYL